MDKNYESLIHHALAKGGLIVKAPFTTIVVFPTSLNQDGTAQNAQSDP